MFALFAYMVSGDVSDWDDLVPINCGFGSVFAENRVAGVVHGCDSKFGDFFICFDLIAFMQQLGQELLM